MHSGEEATTVLNSALLPPISIKARISLSVGRLEETFTIPQRNPKKKGWT